MTIQFFKTVEQFFPVVLFIMLYKVVLTLDFAGNFLAEVYLSVCMG